MDSPADHGQGETVLAEAVSAYKAALGSRLIAGYALGSLAHEGFSPLVSDVDLGLILADPLRTKDRITMHQVTRSVRAGRSAMRERLSVFWATPSILRGQSRGGRFPPLDRVDLLDHGRLLTGEDARSNVARPEGAELLVAGAELALGHLGGARRLSEQLRARLRPRNDVTDDIRSPARLVSPRAQAADQGRALARPLPVHRGNGAGRQQRPQPRGTTWPTRARPLPRWSPRLLPGASNRRPTVRPLRLWNAN